VKPSGTRYQALISDSLGMPVSNQGTDDERFSHGGSNRGFKCTFKGFPQIRNRLRCSVVSLDLLEALGGLKI
jgi:hypothetical protein